MRRPVLALLPAATVLALTACGGGSTTGSHAASSSSQAAPISSAAPSPTPTQPPQATKGQPVTNGGVTLTVTAASVVPTISMNESNYDPKSPYAKFTDEAPPAGAEYYAVTVHVTNNAQVGMDLTCGYPIANKLVNAQQQNYDAIESLYKLKGNPECNNNLQPGFSSDMTYVYSVPVGSTIVGWGFADATDIGNQHDYTPIAF